MQVPLGPKFTMYTSVDRQTESTDVNILIYHLPPGLRCNLTGRNPWHLCHLVPLCHLQARQRLFFAKQTNSSPPPAALHVALLVLITDHMCC